MSSTGFWRERRVLVTGASGFLGSWVATDLVNEGARVVCLIRDIVPESYLNLSGTSQRVAKVTGSVEDHGALVRILNEYEIDTCFHLAAQPLVTIALRHPLATFESNIRGTYALLDAVRTVAPRCRVVVASSDKVYGDARDLPYHEDFILQGLGPYDVSKVCTDLLAQSYAQIYGLRIAIARCGNFYGPGDWNWSRIVPGTSRSLIEGRAPQIRSDGTYVRDYLYIGDASKAYLTLAQGLDDDRVQGQAFNFGTERPSSVLDVVKQLTAISGRRDLKPEVLNAAQTEIKSQYLSTAKARDLLGWRSRVDLDEGLSISYRWYEQQLRRPSSTA